VASYRHAMLHGWRTCTTTRFLAPIDCFEIPAQYNYPSIHFCHYRYLSVSCLCICLYVCIWSIQSASFSICCSEPVFVNVYEAQESTPPGWESIPGFLKGLQIRALSVCCHFCLSFCILDAVTPSVSPSVP
jgi:hypothetical protein